MNKNKRQRSRSVQVMTSNGRSQQVFRGKGREVKKFDVGRMMREAAERGRKEK